MFGIGLPELLLILALALIVVGPDKLPELARSLAKGILELKKTAESVKDSLKEEGNPLDEVRPDLESAAKNLRENLLDVPPYKRETTSKAPEKQPVEQAADAYQELMKHTFRPGSTEPPTVTNSSATEEQGEDTGSRSEQASSSVPPKTTEQ